MLIVDHRWMQKPMIPKQISKDVGLLMAYIGRNRPFRSNASSMLSRKNEGPGDEAPRDEAPNDESPIDESEGSKEGGSKDNSQMVNVVMDVGTKNDGPK